MNWSSWCHLQPFSSHFFFVVVVVFFCLLPSAMYNQLPKLSQLKSTFLVVGFVFCTLLQQTQNSKPESPTKHLQKKLEEEKKS
eukprot:m.17592 g.17592  ORF g.17592 m.17592 type:complete len:83 (+) comp8320_c0_seq1:1111-1359(+)